jgi:hypothetical protein
MSVPQRISFSLLAEESMKNSGEQYGKEKERDTNASGIPSNFSFSIRSAAA